MDREYNVQEWLDEKKENMVFVRYVFLPNFSNIEQFAVIYLTKEGKNWREIIKIDGNPAEAVHIHVSYSDKEKKNLHKPITWETVEEAVDRIKSHWREYLLQHQQEGL
ncbi:MAG: hypothetical protein V1776_05325 [Candidatus Diapherotrites archaeon]